MTDAITPASLRAHANWIDGCGHGLGPGEALRAEAARLEAESARDEEAERYAKVYRRAQRRVYPTLAKWGSLDAETQENYTRPMRAVLDRLEADGRLLPEGGTVLTAEQVADLRWLMAQYVGFDGDIDCPPYASLDALFTPPAVSVPDSGPDGTPEKPWPTWQDVPDGVRYQGSTRYGDKSPVFVNRDGQRITEWRPGVEFANTHPDWAVERWAPFVRVDGDKA